MGLFTGNAKNKYRVHVKSWDGCDQDRFVKLIEEILLPVLKCDVILTVPHGNIENLYEGQDFAIHVWSSPNSSRKMGVPEKIFGIDVSCRDNAFAYSEGYPIEDEQTAYEVAEVFGRNLYIFHDLVHYGSEDELEIFKKILSETVDILSGLHDPLPPQDVINKNFIKKIMVDYNLDRDKESLQREVVQCEVSIKKKIEKLKRVQKALTGLYFSKSTKLATMGFIESDDFLVKRSQELLSEVESILTMPKVGKVVFSRMNLQIYTKTIFCGSYQLGKFLIDIPVKGDSSVKMTNLTNPHGGYMAPHVDSDGDPCLGNMCDVFPELIGSYEWSTLAALSIQFLEAYNDDNYVSVDNWPELTDEEIQTIKKEENQ